jgi:hypothetical protein
VPAVFFALRQRAPGIRSRRRGQAILEARINEICTTRVRYGYRRVHVLLRRGANKGESKLFETPPLRSAGVPQQR